MKKGLIITLITFVCLLALGVTLMIIGISNGGSLQFVADYKNHKVSKDYERKIIEGNETFDSFDKIDIETDYSDLRIVEGDKYGISYRLYEAEKLECKVENDTLIFHHQSKNNVNNFQFSTVWTDSKDDNIYVEITVPKDAKIAQLSAVSNYGDLDIKIPQIDKTNLKFDYGDIKISGLNGTSFETEVDYGDIVLTGSEIDDINIDSDYGNFDQKDSTTKNLTLNMDYGDIDISKTKIDSIDITTNYGDANINLIGEKADFDFDIKLDHGDIKLSGEDYEEKYKDIEGKDKKILIDSDSGDVDITFN